MHSFNTIPIFLTVSLALHAGITTLSYLDWPHASEHEEAIFISFLEEPSIAMPVKPVQVPKIKISHTRLKRGATPELVLAMKAEPQKIPKKSTVEKAQVVQKRTASPSIDPQILQESRQIMADPKKGKIFIGYFGQIKQKIQQTVFKKYARETVGHGSVSLVFVLRRDGRLEQVLIKEKESSGGFLTREFAESCIKEAAPFAAFPKELDSPKISFNLSLFLE